MWRPGTPGRWSFNILQPAPTTTSGGPEISEMGSIPVYFSWMAEKIWKIWWKGMIFGVIPLFQETFIWKNLQKHQLSGFESEENIGELTSLIQFQLSIFRCVRLEIVLKMRVARGSEYMIIHGISKSNHSYPNHNTGRVP